ncbi:alpha/beta hydrolase fold domain-containing protein [Actinophytocola sp.]|uniref:alpha/beta hydrolase fold domain-containing protein n=1 Tax=Actinophytocola sp. TaxID=1872138 RepID=UPI003D6C51DB
MSEPWALARSTSHRWTHQDIVESPLRGVELAAFLQRENGPGPRLYDEGRERLEGDFASIELRVLLPIRHPQAVVVWFLDGLSVLPTADDVDVVVRKLAERTGATWVVVDDPHADRPAADVARLVTEVVLRVRDGLPAHSGPDRPLIVGGQGTGALRALRAALAARDRQDPVAAVLLVAPVVEPPADPVPAGEGTAGTLPDAATIDAFWARYAAGGNADPVLSDDLSGLPPAVVLTAGLDPLADEGEALAQRLSDAGGQVLHYHHADEIHDFLVLLMLRASERGFQQLTRAVRAVIVKGEL